MDDETISMIDALRRVVAEERRYPVEAYVFLYQALDYAQKLLGERRHVSGAELLQGVRALAIETFGPLTLMVFNHWRVRRTDDFGAMVFHLVERGLMGKTDDDKLEDFDGLYDFEEAFAPDALAASLDASTLSPGFRFDTRDLARTSRAAARS